MTITYMFIIQSPPSWTPKLRAYQFFPIEILLYPKVKFSIFTIHLHMTPIRPPHRPHALIDLLIIRDLDFEVRPVAVYQIFHTAISVMHVLLLQT